MCRCNNCGSIVEQTMNGVCPYCGFGLQLAGDQLEMYRSMLKERKMWRIVFLICEIASFFVALFLCWLVAQFLNTDVFERQNWLILAVWAYVAYKIYDKLRVKIM